MPKNPLTTTIKNIPAFRIRSFRRKVHAFYEREGRDLPWRKKINPYRVLVSELMLQQTQAERVIRKYGEFLTAFPDFSSLARAPLAKLLRVWSGLGYNRRALALQTLARTVVDDHGGRLPSDPALLRTLPGIGAYTAGAVAAFAFNKPVVFMDTNIRRVFIHEFFPGRENIRDADLLPLVEQALDRTSPRTWYNALMDYGTRLKRDEVNPNRRSAHYTRQSPFENSNRQVRGLILKALVASPPLSLEMIVKRIGRDAVSIKANLRQLEQEGFLQRAGRRYNIAVRTSNSR